MREDLSDEDVNRLDNVRKQIWAAGYTGFFLGGAWGLANCVIYKVSQQRSMQPSITIELLLYSSNAWYIVASEARRVGRPMLLYGGGMKCLREPSRCVGPRPSLRDLDDAFTGLRFHRGSTVRCTCVPSVLSSRAARVSSGEVRYSILMPSRQNCSRRTWRRLLLECVLEGARLGTADLDSLGDVRIKHCTISRVPSGQRHMWRFTVLHLPLRKSLLSFWTLVPYPSTRHCKRKQSSISQSNR
ncbi:unnamed protein product, partial [Ectocarpus sp. 4 AP-2014]